MKNNYKNQPRWLALAIFFSLLVQLAFAQNGVAIAASAATADPSAMLDIQSTSKGALVPRMTNAQRAAISLPATALLVFCTDAPSGYYYNAGTPTSINWVILSAGALTGTGTTNYISKWTASGVLGNSMVFDNGTNVGIGTASPVNKLQVEGNLHMDGNTIYLRLGAADNYDLIRWNSTVDRIDIGGYNGVNLGYTSPGTNVVTPTLTVASASVGIGNATPSYPLDVSGAIRSTTLGGTGTRPVWSDANGALNNNGRVIGTTTTTSALQTTGTVSAFVSTANMTVASGELIQIAGTVGLYFNGGSGTDHWLITIRMVNVSGCTSTTIAQSVTPLPENATRPATNFQYPFFTYWTANCTGTVNFTIDIIRYDADDGWYSSGATIVATKQ
jgi:hypothetical protein